jgi:hypothetical protein
MIESSCDTHLKKRGTERDKLAHMHFRYWLPHQMDMPGRLTMSAPEDKTDVPHEPRHFRF